MADKGTRRRPILGLICCFSFLAAGCSADTSFVDFASLARTSAPHDALACPEGLCAAKADFRTEIVARPASEMAELAIRTIGAEARTELVAKSDDGLRLVFVQRSRLFRFPDTVNIAIVPIDDGHSAVAIYSRSNYGYGDLGVNRARVEEWAAKLGVSLKVAA